MKRFLAALALTSPRRACLREPPTSRTSTWARTPKSGSPRTTPFRSSSFNISLPAGSAYDPAGKAGLASFAASMMDEGAGGLDSKAFHEALAEPRHFLQRPRRARLSGDLRRHAQGECAGGDASAATGADPPALRCRGGDPRARPDHPVIWSRTPAEPPRVASRAFMRDFFGGHAYAHPVAGEIGSVSSVTAADLRNFARSHWTKYGLKVAVAGDITAAGAGQASGRYVPAGVGRDASRPARCRAGWARRACMWFRCRCRSPASISACPASCATTRISFPAMSPIMCWAAADSPRG